METPLFVEVIPASTGSDLELIELVTRFSEQCLLSIAIRQIGMVRIVDQAKAIVDVSRSQRYPQRRVGIATIGGAGIVRRRNVSAQGDEERIADDCVVARSWESLMVSTVGMAVEAAEHPLKR